MKNYVITIMDNPKSVDVADRCIHSGEMVGMEIEKFPAITPKDDPAKLMRAEGIGTESFNEVYSRLANCQAAFMSHYSLWKKALDTGEEITIFEHDAVILDPIPNMVFEGCINLGQPSYGRWNDPLTFGVNVLTSKRYFPGAHAYRVNQWGAKQLIQQAKKMAKPTDVFLHIDTFPWLQEYYPWPAIARDSFTTIQSDRGIIAKHSYVKSGGKYEII